MSSSPEIDALQAALTLCIHGVKPAIVARAMAAALRKAGFEIVPSRDFSKGCRCQINILGCAQPGCPRIKITTEASHAA